MSDTPGSDPSTSPNDPLAAFGGQAPPPPPLPSPANFQAAEEEVDPLTAEAAGLGAPVSFPAPPPLPGPPADAGPKFASAADPLPGEEATPPASEPAATVLEPPPGMAVPPVMPPPPAPPPPTPPLATSPLRQPAGEPYPATLEIQHRELSRASTFFRLPLLIPVQVVWTLVVGLSFAAWPVARLATLFARKHPNWLFAAQAGAIAYQARATAYAYLLTDQFPAFGQEPQTAVQAGFEGHDQGTYSRWQGVIWRLMVCVPHFFVLWLLYALVLPFVTLGAWFAILFTGSYPRGLSEFTEGVLRWTLRVQSYVFLLNDRFPPYALSATAAPAGSGAVVGSAIAGWVLGGGSIAAVVAAAIASGRPMVEEVDYARLLQGRDQVTNTLVEPTVDTAMLARLTLVRAYDPADELFLVLDQSPDHRVIVFEWELRTSGGDEEATVALRDENTRMSVRYEDEDGEEVTRTLRAAYFGVGSQPRGALITSNGSVFIRAVFVVPADAEPLNVHFDLDSTSIRTIRYEFE